MNGVDDSRINDTTKGGVVVNLDEYRAQAGTRSVSTAFLPASFQWSAAVIAVIALCALLAFVRR